MKKIKLKKIEEIQLNEAYNKILNWFFSFPLTPISLTDLSSNLNISKRTASVIVKKLVEEGFLLKDEIGKVWRIYCNQKHPYNFTRKISYNLSLIYSLLYENGLISEIYKVVGNPNSILLFGSYRKGDDIEKSDIDIAVEILGNEELKIIPLGSLEQFGYRKDVPVNLYVFSRNKIDRNLFANIANGIVLEGFLEVIP